ncbi:RAB6A-GEF complex partner protein 2-like [Daktulosphaira vitifoliae]|uniref:RAB6A-GEF complex partner protein 2-like n=1 Tax=Daktulosphaira vitifoliae TaxID=58002 RepID=UPI0021AAB948|nr:RAB6A-GEF complex partner protein 2-like [Daktulosphaira vitifoliae]
MIEVSTKLIGGPIFMPGSKIGCCITFTHPPLPSDSRSQSNDDVLENLAWASVQINCLCLTNDNINFPLDMSVTKDERFLGNSETSFAPCLSEHGHVVLSTKPKILFCDVRLSPGESKSYLYSETLSNDAPPSYKGHLVKYAYKITVGMQRLNCPIKLLRVPLRVVVICGLTEGATCENSVDLSPSNPFIESKDKHEESDMALQILQNITAKRSPNFYNITNSKGKVARFCLFKQAYKLGEDIVGTFDFEQTDVSCIEFTVSLQCEEEVNKEFIVSNPRSRKDNVSISSYNTQHQFCANTLKSFLQLAIPLNVTPAFNTLLVSVKWRLHFEFVTSTKESGERLVKTKEGSCWTGPEHIAIETMVWDLPIHIYPSVPSTASDPHAQTRITIAI